ncbi:MAG: NAD(P)/FAD-dependent oxidoreductase [Acidimicrobiales bacterium]|nr:NAD(P)/FAD-dependent oxidoreductase [Acidimicrobiales bacterium]
MNTASTDFRVVIIGAGMSGILSVIKLREMGITNLTVYEKAEKLGGTWRDNNYPGVACDVPSHLYSYSFAPNPDWSHRFSPGAEIQTYLESVAADHAVEDSVIYGVEVTELKHQDGRWRITTDDGRQDQADVVIAATGVLHHPAWPDIAGLHDFVGQLMHTARWDSSVSLEGLRVGIIGTGSSAIQTVPTIVDHVDHLTLFQRTAQWVLPQENPAYTEEERASFRSDPSTAAALHDEISELFANGFSNAVVDANSELLHMIEETCRLNLEESVTDLVLREQLRPDYRAACKRLVISPNFYEGIQKPNASLVTETITEVEPNGVRTVDGQFHELDALIVATGFQVDRFLRPIDVINPDGLHLSEAWAKRPNAYLSVAVPGFPNLFMLNGPNGPVGNFSLIEVAELQFAYFAQLIELLRSGEAEALSPTFEATEAFEGERVEQAKKTVWATGCRSWYLDDRGVPAAWPWTFQKFRQAMKEPDLSHFTLSRNPQPVA